MGHIISRSTPSLKYLKMFGYLFILLVLCSVTNHGNAKRHWWGQNGYCKTQVEFGNFPQNGRKPVELVVTFDTEIDGLQAHGDMFKINGKDGMRNGKFYVNGTEFTITKKESKLINEFSNLSLKPIVFIDAGKCWEATLPDLSYTWTYTDYEQTCTGTSEDSRDVRNAECGPVPEMTDAPGTFEPGTDAPGTFEPGTDAPGTDAPEPPLPGGRRSMLKMRRYRMNKLH